MVKTSSSEIKHDELRRSPQENKRNMKNYVEDKLKTDLKDIDVILKGKASKYKDWDDVKQVAKTVREFKERDSDMALTVKLQILKVYMCALDLAICWKWTAARSRQILGYQDEGFKKEIDHFRKLAVDVKVHIKLVLLAINELQATLSPKGQ
ncbi:hypothetical protein NQ317_014835 [Molorchus minor]|uniref:Uncharacterized protein n=1 Tax=Molorchus minor TaxID=1323400 RepID=A0ABQ9JTP3_9CUCU|nr:hypothetical protein NQ317_014835 [Molorchus minor]